MSQPPDDKPDAPRTSPVLPEAPQRLGDLSPGSSGIDYGAVPKVSPDGVVAVDLACPRCGYNVRGVPGDARCPECGLAVELALRGDRIRFGDPAWIMSLAHGVRLILWSIATSIFAGILSAVPGMVVTPTIAPVVTLLALLAATSHALGAWLLTAADPSGLGEASCATPRKVVRVLVPISLASAIVGGLGATLGFGLLQPLIAAAALLAGAAVQVAVLVYVERLCRRVPDPAMAERARVIRWGVLVSYGVIFLGMVFAAFMVAGMGGSGAAGAMGLGMFGCFTASAVLALVVFNILYLVLLVRLGRLLNDEAGAARRLWPAAAESGAGS